MTTRSFTRSLRSGAVCAVAVLALAGCGSTATTAGTSATAAVASSSAAAAGKKVGDTITLVELNTATQQAMQKAGTAKITMDSDSMKGQGVANPATGDLKISATSDGEAMEMIIVDKSLYLGGEALKDALQAGKKWLKVSPDGEDMLSKLFAPMLEQLGNATNVGKLLDGIAADAEVTAVEGGLTTYTVTLTGDQMVAMAKKMLGDMASSFPSASASAVAKTSTKVVWTVDTENLPTKVVTESTNQGKISTQTITYSDWGTVASVTAPPAAEVGTFSMPTK